MEQGLAELERWLSDLVRGGVAAAPSRSYAYWDAAAARLVDAQAPRLARRVRELAGAALARDEWTERLVGDLGRLALLVDAARHLDELPPDLGAEVRSQLGFTVASEDVARGEPVEDDWHVVGQVLLEEERLRTRRTWLVGERQRTQARC